MRRKLTGWSCLASACLGLAVAVAQSSIDPELDAQLNRAYQQLMRSLPAARGQQLRNSERAWLEFSARNRIALRAAAGKTGAAPELFEQAELKNRVNQLEVLLHPGFSEKLEPNALKILDDQLNVTYQRALGMVGADAATKLREAQRSWIAFRDANRAFGPAIINEILYARVTQLENFYIESANYQNRPENEAQALAQEPDESPPAKADATVPDPFERAR